MVDTMNVGEAMTREVPVLTGLGALYGLFDLEQGSAGFNTGFAFPEVLMAMVRSAEAGDWATARALYARFLPLIVFEQQPGVAIRKEILRRRGLLAGGRVRHPGAGLAPEIDAQLSRLLEWTLPGVDLTQRDGALTITINRPDKMNAFRGTTCDELIKALYKAGYDKDVGAIVLAGAGDRAFCTGGDQSAHDGNYDGRGTVGLPMEELHTAIRDVPKPVIARVQGYAIGGGNVLCTICDLTICSDKAIFGQVGPKMGSVDPGYGTAFLARVVGEKKARGIRLAVMDMWKPFRNATTAHAPKAAILFDKFHVIRHLNEALDKVRKSEYARLSGKEAMGFI